AAAVRETTRTTPTVFVQVSDPVTAGVVQSLARPGGNLTGFTNFEPSMASKWLELVKGIAPNIRRIAYLFNPNTAPLLYARAVETAAPLLSIKPFAAEVRNADEMEGMIEQFAREPDSALLVLPDLFTATNRRSIIALAARHSLPAVYPFRYFVASGGLMSYGIETLETYRQAASYVARVLKGENPSDLPVQAPTKYELVLNLKTAKAIGRITCNRASGLIDISPVKGRSWARISNIDAAIPVAKIPIAIIEASRLSLWTMAIATRVQTACMDR